MANQDERQGQLLEPGFGHRNIKQDIVVLDAGREGFSQRGIRLAGLSIGKLPADALSRRQVTDRFRSRQHLNAKILAMRGGHIACT